MCSNVLCCGFRASCVLETRVIRVIPRGDYVVNGGGTYLFYFTPSVPFVEGLEVNVVLPRRGQLGESVILTNFSSPADNVYLGVYVGGVSGSQGVGYPLRIGGYQQQQFWWVPGAGWMYAGGFSAGSFGIFDSDRAAYAPAPSEAEEVTFNVDDNYPGTGLQVGGVMSKVDTAYCFIPMLDLTVLSLDPSDVSLISGSISGVRGVSVTIIGNDSNSYPSVAGGFSFVGGLTFLECIPPSITGSLNVTAQLNLGWKYGAYNASIPAEDPTVQTITFTSLVTCGVVNTDTTSSVFAGQLYTTNIEIYIPSVINEYSRFVRYTVGSDTYGWYFSNYSTNAYSLPVQVVIYNYGSNSGTPVSITATGMFNSTVSETITSTFFFGDNGVPGTPSYGFGVAPVTLNEYPTTCTNNVGQQVTPLPYPVPYKPHVVLDAPAPGTPSQCCIAGSSYYNSWYGNGPYTFGTTLQSYVMNGYVSVYPLFPLLIGDTNTTTIVPMTLNLNTGSSIVTSTITRTVWDVSTSALQVYIQDT